jgi:hypothetical protein
MRLELSKFECCEPAGVSAWRDGGLSAGVTTIVRIRFVPEDGTVAGQRITMYCCSRSRISQAINQYRSGCMSMRRQIARIRTLSSARGGRRSWWTPELVEGPPTKAELREQAAEAGREL